jgi:hypothetical protein
MQSARGLRRIVHWADDAAANLDRAVRGMRLTTDLAASTLEEAGDAPLCLNNTMLRFLDATQMLAHLFVRLESATDWLLFAAELDLPEVSAASAPAPRRIALHRVVVIRCPDVVTLRTYTVSLRRRRFRLAVPEGVRRIVRGRAPPFSSICPL